MPITKKDFEFVGEDLQIRGDLKRWMEQVARERTQQEGHPVTVRQVAEGLVQIIRDGVAVQAHLVQAFDKLRRLTKG